MTQVAGVQSAHGTLNRFLKWGCRCELCREVNNERIRRYRKGPGREKFATRIRSYQRRNPHRKAAWQLVYKAVRDGRLTKPDRCACGRDARILAHHDDYSKPLDVLWLCGTCHEARHQLLRQIKPAA